MNDERRREMRALRLQALAVENQLKERKTTQLLKQVKSILSKCIPADVMNVSHLGTSDHRSLTKPNQPSSVKNKKDDLELLPKELPQAYSLPSTPLYDEKSIDQLHSIFLALKEEPKELSFSEASAISTDIGKYMNDEDTIISSDSTTPRAMSAASENLECSTPIKADGVRRLSYTLEAPSPVLLKLLQSKSTTGVKELSIPVPPINLPVDSEKEGVKPNVEQQSNSSYIMDHQKRTANYQESEKENSPSYNRVMEQNMKNKLDDTNIDHLNGNKSDKIERKTEEKSLSLMEDSNGNQRSVQQGTDKKANMLEEFLLQQQKLMNDLLEKQAKEQERLVNLFKEQEQQLCKQLQSQSSRNTSTPAKSPVCRNLEQSFNRCARAKQLFNSCHLAALVRGYLTRRLLATDRVQAIIQTIRDTTTCLKDLNQGSLAILPCDIQLHQRLIQQLNGAIHSLHDIFFEWDISERMLVIARDREKKAGQLIITRRPVRIRPRSRSLSSATLKSLERKHSRQDSKPEGKLEQKVESRQDSRNSSRPSSASTVLPRTSPSSIGSSICPNRRSPSSISSSSNCTVQSNGYPYSCILSSPYPNIHSTGSFNMKAKQQLQLKSKKPWR